MAASASAPKTWAKIILLGDVSQGKSCVCNRWIADQFVPNMPPTFGASFTVRTCVHEGKEYRVGIWDTAGQERFDCLASFFCRGAHVAIVCYSVVEKSCRLNFWANKLLAESGVKDPLIVFCGTKMDLLASQPRAWDPAEIAEIRSQYKHTLHMETSALSGAGIKEMFAIIVAHLVSTLPAPNAQVDLASGPTGRPGHVQPSGRRPGQDAVEVNRDATQGTATEGASHRRSGGCC